MSRVGTNGVNLGSVWGKGAFRYHRILLQTFSWFSCRRKQTSRGTDKRLVEHRGPPRREEGVLLPLDSVVVHWDLERVCVEGNRSSDLHCGSSREPREVCSSAELDFRSRTCGRLETSRTEDSTSTKTVHTDMHTYTRVPTCHKDTRNLIRIKRQRI